MFCEPSRKFIPFPLPDCKYRLLSDDLPNIVAVPAEGSVVPPKANLGVVAVVPSKVNAEPVANALVLEA